MARPDANFRRDVNEKRSNGAAARRGQRGSNGHRRMSEFPLRRWRNLTAEGIGHQLHAITNPQHGRTQVEQLGIAFWRSGVRHALRAAGKNNAERSTSSDLLRGDIWRPD